MNFGLPRQCLLLGTIGQIAIRKGLDTIPLVLRLLGIEGRLLGLSRASGSGQS